MANCHRFENMTILTVLTLVHLGVCKKCTTLPKIACHFKSDVPRAMKTLDFFFGIIYHLLIEFFF